MKSKYQNLNLVLLLALSTLGLSAAFSMSQQSASAQQIAGMIPTPSNQSSQLSSNQTQGIMFQGNSTVIVNLANADKCHRVCLEDRWDAIDQYTSSGYDIRGVVNHMAAEENSTRVFVILERRSQ
jgi:hypothetical protein